MTAATTSTLKFKPYNSGVPLKDRIAPCIGHEGSNDPNTLLVDITTRRAQAKSDIENAFRGWPTAVFFGPPDISDASSDSCSTESRPLHLLQLKPVLYGAKILLPQITELRVLHKLLLEPSCPPSTWLPWCLTKGLPFRIIMEPQNSGYPASSSSSSSLFTAPGPICSDGNVCQKYISSVQALLRLPGATRFLAEGGLLWRLALAYGPSGLYTGDGSITPIEWANDPPTDHDVNTMIGKCEESNGTFWPPIDLFNTSRHFHGEWSLENEFWFIDWFQGIADSARETECTFRRRFQREWRNQFCRKGGSGQVAPELMVGTPSHATRLLADLSRSYPDVVKSVAETVI